MTGRVDEKLRSLVVVPLSATRDGPRTEVETWVDTAFIGTLALPNDLVVRLGLHDEAFAEAILADGQIVMLETFTCYYDWFGGMYKTQITAGDNKLPLLGTVLLDSRKLEIDYRHKTLALH